MTALFDRCPACGGHDHSSDEAHDASCLRVRDCPTCQGSGERVMDQQAYEMALSAWDRLNERVEAVFALFCQGHGIHRAYGIEKWEPGGDTIDIIQDTSCMGCRDTDSHSFPTRWLWTADEAILAEIANEIAAKKARERREAEARAKSSRTSEIARLEARLQELRGGAAPRS